MSRFESMTSRILKSSNLWVECVTNIWEGNLVGELEERNNFEDFCLNERLILNDFEESDVWLTVHRNSVWIRKTN